MSSSQVLWILALAFIPTGVLAAAAAYRRIRQIRRLVRQGERAQGVVVRLEPTQLEGPGSDAGITLRSSGTTVYYRVIAWATADGQAMETRTPIARSLERGPRLGARVEVRYDPAKPTRWTPAAESTGLWWLFVAVGGVFVAVGSGLFVGALASGR
ncbi:DUF3592 domain-containing protein [Streptomyces sp. NPDC092046]|uniref:DUF3592 domain-containing protein n=1 Tax=Streptomyces sp. NPDC092046 TaxID=3366009 RepID=UPI00382E7103